MSARFPVGKDQWHKRGPNSHGGEHHYVPHPRELREKKPRKGGEHQWNPQFLAIDGEGFTENGQHRYMLLASSDGSYEVNQDGLTTVQCFDYLFAVHRAVPKLKMVCYGASYDVNMMLRDLPREQVAAIWSGQDVTITTQQRRYRVRYTHRKSLWVSRWNGQERESFTLYDCFGFFQTSFVQALKDWLGSDYAELPLIESGKARRSQFAKDELPSILAYCQAELCALVRMMNAVRDSLRLADIHVAQWYGPGAIASRLLTMHKMHDHQRDTYHEAPKVYDAARHAFAGGRIELLQYGLHDGPLYHYDLNSAYVGAIVQLPAMPTVWHLANYYTHGHPFSMCHVRWQAADDSPFYPFFYRNPQGLIYFPRAGEGWYWGVELEAPMQLFGGSIQILEQWIPATDALPPAFSWVREAYAQRRQWKEEGNAAHKTLKLGLNSLYGKLIQHVGSDPTRQALPAFHQLEWAGYITATIRAKLYEAAMQNPNAIVCFQTDAIISTEPLQLDIGPGLGQWTEEEECSKGLFVQSGIYWIWEKDNGMQQHYRGFDPGGLSDGMVINAWESSKPSLPVPSTRFMTMGSALANQWDDWCSWRTIERELALSPQGTKRMDIEPNPQPSKRLVRTAAQENFLRLGISEPYALPWDSWEKRGSEIIDGVGEQLYYGEHEDTWL